MTALQDLLAKVEEGWPPDIDTPYLPPFREIWPDWRAQSAWQANEGSLDAAKALHEALLPGWGYHCGEYGARVWLHAGDEWRPEKRQDVELADQPARAWLIAILRALIAQEGEA